MSDSPPDRPRPLQRDDRCEDFDCGSEPLNEYLRRFAWTNQQAGAARIYVATRGKRIVGYYTLACASIEHQAAAPRIRP